MSYYEINVSLHGSHFFATHERSCDTLQKAVLVLDTLREKFPESEGYGVSPSYQEVKGRVNLRIKPGQSSSDVLQKLAK